MNKRDELLLCIAGHVRPWLSEMNARKELKELITDASEEAALEEPGITMGDIIESRERQTGWEKRGE